MKRMFVMPPQANRSASAPRRVWQPRACDLWIRWGWLGLQFAQIMGYEPSQLLKGTDLLQTICNGTVLVSCLRVQDQGVPKRATISLPFKQDWKVP